jgi:acylpyruvate hydrolase
VRILTYLRAGEPRLGILIDEMIYDVAACSTHLGVDELPSDLATLLAARGPAALEDLCGRIEKSRQAPGDLPSHCSHALGEVGLLAPIPRPPKLICLGRNYRDHIEEQGAKPPEAPLLFSKASSCVIGPGRPIVVPRGSTKVDFEGEVAFVIGKRVKRPADREAEEAIFGYTCLNDVTEREAQFGEKQWFRGKSMDTFAPLGPWIVTKDEIGDPLDMRIITRLNSEVMQSESTGKLIFPPVEIIRFAAATMTLEPGDIISTGTPGGVGVFREPQVFLKPGDVVEIEVDKIGKLANPVEAE